jgi:hypothetical protein
MLVRMRVLRPAAPQNCGTRTVLDCHVRCVMRMCRDGLGLGLCVAVCVAWPVLAVIAAKGDAVMLLD